MASGYPKAMDLGISGRKAIITGADSGIGFETAKLLLEEGVQVAITDIDEGRLKDAARRLPGEVTYRAADLTDLSSVEAMRDYVVSNLGTPDIVVNCAGITGAQGAFHEIDDAGWMEALDTNLMSAVRVVRSFLPGMRESGWGRVVLIGSEDGLQPYADELPYCASKAAIINLAKGLSKQYASEGILVNSVSPAFIATPMTDAMMKKRADENGSSFEEAIESFLEEERPGMQINRRGEASEVASVIAFLCSERASFVNGSNYRVDAGSVEALG